VIRPEDIRHAEGLERLFAPLRDAAAVLVAVSGGPDSVALLHLLGRWRDGRARPALIAATVDHGLRPQSAAEAAMVADQAALLGVPHRTLLWTEPKPRSRLQEAAREARYALLVAEARRGGAGHLVTAHTCDDQAETVLMRLARGSGIAGLAGMRPTVDRDGICHLRPFLGVSKATLVDLCREEGWSFAEDPSNSDDRFARARWRKLLPGLAAEGMTAERLCRLAERAGRVEEALATRARAVFAEASRAGGPDPLRLAAALRDEPFEIALRVLALALCPERPDEHLRLQRLETAVERLRGALQEGRASRVTLAGRVLDLDRNGYLRLGAEPVRRRGRYTRVSDDDAGRPASLGKAERHA
jgi:tRNA(Ile)-lysidine synthase